MRAGGCRYVLRVGRPGCKEQAAIHSELEWVDAIARDTDLVVRAPVVNREGRLLTVASTPGVPEPRVCALFRWVKGRFVSQHDLTGRHLVMVGRLMGRLHDHAAGFVPSSGFTRMVWDADGLLGVVRGCTPVGASALLDPERRAIVDRAEAITRGVMAQLGETASVFGLIHSDLHQANYVFLKGEARALDFDDCGWGYYLCDMASTLGPLVSRSDFALLRASFLRGYRSVRALDADHERLLTAISDCRPPEDRRLDGRPVGQPRSAGRRGGVRSGPRRPDEKYDAMEIRWHRSHIATTGMSHLMRY